MRSRPGFTVFLTGLSGAGKSTITTALGRMIETRGRAVRILDGDTIREIISSDLSFSIEDRAANVRRFGLVAADITERGGVAICALIAPSDMARKQVRAMVSIFGGFVLVHVATPLRVCEERDSKGLYDQARAGQISDFTGVSSPYEPPLDAEVTVDTITSTPEDAARDILRHLRREGYIQGD